MIKIVKVLEVFRIFLTLQEEGYIGDSLMGVLANRLCKTEFIGPPIIFI